MNKEESVITNKTTIQHVLYPNEMRIYTVSTTLFLVVGASLNFYFICTYYWSRIRRTHFNYCLMHLSVSCLVQYLGFIPYISLDVQNFSARGIIADHILCALKDGLSVFFVGAFSTAIIASYITVVRYKLIKSPLYRFRLKKCKTFRFFILIWCAGFVMLMPNFFTLRSKENWPVCVRTYSSTSLLIRIYVAVTTIIAVGAPSVILVVTYILTIKQLYFTQKSDVRRHSYNKSRNSKKVLRLFGIFIISMILTWLPFFYIWVRNAHGDFGKAKADEIRKARMYRFMILPSLVSGMVIVASGSFKCNMSRINTLGNGNTISPDISIATPSNPSVQIFVL